MLIMKRFYMVVSLVAVLLVQLCLATTSSNFTDILALLAFKSEIKNDPNNVLGSNWTETESFCNWVGVSCSRRRQRVTTLILTRMGLQGTISPYVGNLSFLVRLDLRNNSFHGHLIPEIGRLHRLRVIILEYNLLEGVIPASVYHCQTLQVISLVHNKLRGVLPKYWLSNLTSLHTLLLGNNNFTGTIPPPLVNNSKLLYLGLEYNKLYGSIPDKIGNLKNLKILDLEANNLNGTIPNSIFKISSLRELELGFNSLSGTLPSSFCLQLPNNNSKLLHLGLEYNKLHGSIPDEIGNLKNLKLLDLEANNLNGTIPNSIFNITSLRVLELGFNSLSGTLPSSFGLQLPNLRELYLNENQLSGRIPSYLSNCSQLTLLELSHNQFTGPVPASLGHLENLQILNLEVNQLENQPGSLELCFLTDLTRCRSLKILVISKNPFSSLLQDSVGNLSSSLQVFVVESCNIKGPIPKGIGALRNLNILALSDNNLRGTIPSTIKGMKSLQRLYLDGNQLEQSIPTEICLLANLGEMAMQNNNLSGPIPSCIGNLIHLQIMFLSSNALSSSIPSSLWSLENMLFLNLSFNSLEGNLHANMRALKMLQSLDLSWNRISGKIPAILQDFQSLIVLNLSWNSFLGAIPGQLGNLITLDSMDLSHNNLSGEIPKSLVALSHLHYLNLSFNKLFGEIQRQGPFANFTAASFFENEALYGQPIFQVPPCHTTGNPKAKFLLKFILPIFAFTSILIVVTLIMMKHRKNNVKTQNTIDVVPAVEHRLISYQDLRYATNDFSEANILGVGSFGSVFKGILSEGTLVAVKVLNLQLEGAFKSFDAECKVFARVRHRNLVKVISSCSNPELRALVLQYMPNGSLEKWLYSFNYCLSLFQRVSIMLDVATALEYLHHGQSEPVVHCDLKPSNVLLDDEMVAHVGDFGIAKILAENKTATQTKTLGTLGYIAPEYGSEGRVSTRGDIYSYGIMLLEMLTRKKPIDEMFVGELSLRQWVKASVPYKIMEVIDGNLLRTEQRNDAIAAQGDVLTIMELGLECSRELPKERIDIKDVIIKLNKIKSQMR